jgi:ribonuclease P protein component
MTPPVAPVDGQDPETVTPPAVSVCPQVLRKRADFLRASQARRQGTPAFLLQGRKRREDEDGQAIRVGFTCSKKVGNAVTRNRAKRRLREAARLVLPLHGRPGWDYVLVGRRDDTASREFEALLGDLVRALELVHAKER